jgi:hypothetical protein
LEWYFVSVAELRGESVPPMSAFLPEDIDFTALHNFLELGEM